MYSFIMHWKQMRKAAKASGAKWPMPESIQAAQDHFMEIARKKKMTRLDEWNEGFGALEKAVERGMK